MLVGNSPAREEKKVLRNSPGCTAAKRLRDFEDFL